MKLFTSKKPAKTPAQEVEAQEPSTPAPAHYRVPDEVGYFPAGSDDLAALLAEFKNVSIYQIHPPRGGNKSDEPLTTGTFTLRDPDGGTADDVAFVGRVGDTLCYVLADDATAKISATEFSLLLPNDCIVLDLSGSSASEADILNLEALLAARTKFHDETAPMAYPEGLPTDSVSRAIYKASSQISGMTVSAARAGASKIDAYGEKKKEGVTETKEVKVGKTSIMLAKGTRAVSKKTADVTVSVSDKISDVLGGKVSRAVEPKKGDSALKKKGRDLLMASAMAYTEVGNGATEGYELMVKSAQEQATSYVDKKYGKEAAELARHTAGAAANFGRAALTARRVVDAKKLVKTAAKRRVAAGVKSAIS